MISLITINASVSKLNVCVVGLLIFSSNLANWKVSELLSKSTTKKMLKLSGNPVTKNLISPVASTQSYITPKFNCVIESFNFTNCKNSYLFILRPFLLLLLRLLSLLLWCKRQWQ